MTVDVDLQKVKEIFSSRHEARMKILYNAIDELEQSQQRTEVIKSDNEDVLAEMDSQLDELLK